MGQGSVEVHNDDSPIIRCLHDGANGATILRNMTQQFKSCGATIGSAIYNDTAGTNGLITSVTEIAVIGAGLVWNRGDQFSIYITPVMGSRISSIETDRRFGQKVTDKGALNEFGFKPEDTDIDETERNVFGPGQPEKIR